MNRGDSKIGRWHVRDVLGSGGFGTVWRVDDALGVLPQGALKIFNARNAHADQVDEVRRIASLQHSHVLPYLDSGVRAAGELFLVTLCADDVLSNFDPVNGIPERLLADALSGAARGLYELHKLADPLVHRDVSPSNIFRCGNRWMIGDLGIALNPLLPGSHSRGTGKMRYMSTAQRQGIIHPDNDVFALGAIAQEYLCSESHSTNHGPPDMPVWRLSLALPPDWFVVVKELTLPLPRRPSAAWAADMFDSLGDYRPLPDYGWDVRDLPDLRFTPDLATLIRWMRIHSSASSHRHIYEFAKAHLYPKTQSNVGDLVERFWLNLYPLMASLALGYGQTSYNTAWLHNAEVAFHETDDGREKDEMRKHLHRCTSTSSGRGRP
jgi:serine/threonine protein kinase